MVALYHIHELYKTFVTMELLNVLFFFFLHSLIRSLRFPHVFIIVIFYNL